MPDSKIIELYKRKARSFYCAGKKEKDDDENYGVILVDCDILNKMMYVKLEGNAFPIYESNITKNNYL